MQAAQPRESHRLIDRSSIGWVLVGALAIAMTGCTPFTEYVHNGFKVGPNYTKAPAPVAALTGSTPTSSAFAARRPMTPTWWTAFNDPILDDLIRTAYRQNLSVREGRLPRAPEPS